MITAFYLKSPVLFTNKNIFKWFGFYFLRFSFNTPVIVMPSREMSLMSLNSFFGSLIGKQIGFTFVEIVCLKEHSQMKSFLE